MKKKSIAVISDKAIEVIEALQHNCGTHRYYNETLTRLFNLILAMGDEIGMDDTETVHTLRVLKALKTDRAYLAGCGDISEKLEAEVSDHEPEEAGDEAAGKDAAEKVESTFSNIQDPAGADAGEQVIASALKASQCIVDLQSTISTAISWAIKAGEKYESVLSDLCDINVDLEPITAKLDEIKAIDPDTYEPEVLTYAQQAGLFLQRSYENLIKCKLLLVDAQDCAVRVPVEEDLMLGIKKAITEADVNAGRIDRLLMDLNGDAKEDNTIS